MMHATIDFTFPLVFGLFFYLLINRLSLKFSHQKSYLPFLAFLPTGFDLAENLTLIYITNTFPDFPQRITAVVPFLTIGKFVCLVIMVIFIIILAIKVTSRAN